MNSLPTYLSKDSLKQLSQNFNSFLSLHSKNFSPALRKSLNFPSLNFRQLVHSPLGTSLGQQLSEFIDLLLANWKVRGVTSLCCQSVIRSHWGLFKWENCLLLISGSCTASTFISSLILNRKNTEKDYVSFLHCVYIKPNCGPFLISKMLPWQLPCTALTPPAFEAHHLCKSCFAS